MSEAAERKRFDLGGYVEVKDRIARFYELFGQGRLTTERVEILTAPDGKQRVMVHAQAFRTPDDPHPGDGYSWLEIPGTTPYTKGSEVENAETSAWGRAIGSLGILIDASIASQNEIDAKAGETTRPNLTVVGAKAPTHEATSDGGLIGTAQAGEAPADFQLREEPDGYALSFKLMDGRKGFRVVARDETAMALALIPESVLGQRVTCWGRIRVESFPKGEKTINYNVLDLDRIAGSDFLIPTTSSETEEGASREPAAPDDTALGADVTTGAGDSIPAPSPALCGSPSPYGDDTTCALAPDHKGPHKQFEGFGTSWTD